MESHETNLTRPAYMDEYDDEKDVIDMRPDEDADIRFREYLLGQLPEQRQQQLEERLMTDEAVYEELLIQEDELIDDFVEGDLSESDQERFKEHFLCTPARDQKVRFAQALERYIQSSPAEIDERPSLWHRLTTTSEWSRPAFQWATAAAFVVLVSGGVFSAFENRRLDGEVTGLQGRLETLNQTNRGLSAELNSERENRAAMEQELSSLRSSPSTSSASTASSAPTLVSYILQPGLLRDLGQETQRVVVSDELKLLELRLDIGLDDYASYRAVLHDVEGEELWAQNKLEAEPRDGTVLVLIELPSSALRPGDFYMRLSGRTGDGDLEFVGRYHFRAART